MRWNSLFEGEISSGKMLFARAVSVALQPTVISIPVFILLCLPLLPDTAAFITAVAVTTLMLSVIPTVNVYYFSIKTNNKDGDIEKREERAVPMIVGLALYILAAVIITFIEAPGIVKVFTWVYVVSTVIVAVISSKWKISLHMSGVAGPVVALGTAFFPWGWISALIIPLVAWSRYVQRKHTPLQLLCGTLEGIAVTALAFYLFL